MKSYLKVMIFLISIFAICGAQMALACGYCPPPSCYPPPPSECRVTGGGINIDGEFPVWDGTMAWGRSKKDRRYNRYTFGGQAGAPTAAQPQPYGEWTHHQQSGPDGSFVFHAGTASAPAGTEIDLVICSDPGGCSPSGDPPSPNKQIDFNGLGSFRNIKNSPSVEAYAIPVETLHWFEVHIEDLGEPGKRGKQNPGVDCVPYEEVADCDCPDYYEITIYAGPDDSTGVIYNVGGYIKGGNLQMHYPVK